jgi:para-nitrobenzyl esterase
VRGRSESGCFVFRGIPYAASPVGPRRFALPERPAPWEGVLDAFEYGPTAPQPYRPFTLIPEPIIPGGGSCLNLNVTTPSLGDARLPVFVWIHGGGYFSGCNASPWYVGSSFARDGIVLVSVNYRLGVEGFLLMDGAPPNRAVHDWVAALEWVQENVAAFGGDPGRVTIGGQSAGGGAAATLLAVPRAAPLFRRAIMMSGSIELFGDLSQTEEFGRGVASQLGVTADCAGFESADPERLLEFAMPAGEGPPDPVAIAVGVGRLGLPLQPVADGDLVTESPAEALAGGKRADAEILVGATEAEFQMVFQPFGDRMDSETVVKAGLALGLTEEQVSRYRDLRGELTAANLVGRMVTDRLFRVPSVRTAELRPGSPTYVYDFRWESRSTEIPNLGACHCIDVPFAFDLLEAEGVEQVLGPEPPQTLADEVHGAWVSFIGSGDPGWPAYAEDGRAIMVFRERGTLESDPLAFERESWSHEFVAP